MPEACSLHGADRGTGDSAFHLYCRYHKEVRMRRWNLDPVFVPGAWVSGNRVLEVKCLRLESRSLEQGLGAGYLGLETRPPEAGDRISGAKNSAPRSLRELRGFGTINSNTCFPAPSLTGDLKQITVFLSALVSSFVK